MDWKTQRFIYIYNNSHNFIHSLSVFSHGPTHWVSDPPLPPPLSSLGVFCPHITETKLISSSKNHNTQKMSDIWGDALYPLTSLNDAVCVFVCGCMCVCEREEGISSCSSTKLFPTKCRLEQYSMFFTLVRFCAVQYSVYFSKARKISKGAALWLQHSINIQYVLQILCVLPELYETSF